MKPIIQKVIVGGIIVNNGKVLIIQRSSDEETYPNFWEFPSGKKEPLEKISDAILREVKEETGLTTQIIQVSSVFDFVVEKESETRDATQINYILKILGSDKVRLSSEHQNFAWITLDETDKYSLSDEIKKSIELAFRS